MSSNRAKRLSDQYAFQTTIISHHVDGITDEESLLQPPFEANPLNWILGHILARRHSAIEALGSGLFWSEDLLEIYRTGSEPIHTNRQAIPFSTLLSDLERSMDQIQSELRGATDTYLEKLVVNDRGEKTAAEHLEGFLWHETFHIGQLDILRAFIISRRAE